MAGGAHHTVYSQPVDTRHIEIFSEMAEDRTELNDLSDKYPERLDQMNRDWSQWATAHTVPQ